MKFRVALDVVYFGNERQYVRWVEEGLVKRGPNNEDVGVSKEEAEQYFRDLFLKLMKEKGVFTPPMEDGFIAFVPFEQVFRISFKVSEFTEEEADVQSN